ncbi:hypothetical protein GCM10010302_73760 [Streptomyces polychromogenes]|uniref:Uncharacterized protein n=1 Tax=Streptomyces polychromogenes TaxID=67342 RepID=A0ABP3FR92_9ACTN
MAEPAVWQPLSEDVRRTLELLLDGPSDVHRALRTQIPCAEMRDSGCSCPCVYLRVVTEALEAAPTGPGLGPVASAPLLAADGGYDGEATLFAYDGVLEDLQFCDWEDHGPGPRPLWEWLGPRPA